MCPCKDPNCGFAERIGSNDSELLSIEGRAAISFTMIKVGCMDAQVAFGRRLDGSHVVAELGAGDHPAFAVASDVVEVVTRSSETRRS
jgi:hypothetical protein